MGDARAGDPLVSVIVAAHNAEAFIAATCASALAQTYRHIEVIVVDDGSTDGTAGIVEAMAHRDPRLRLIRQPNKGVAASRNRAIADAGGEFIAPLDADDLWRPGKIEQQVRRLHEYGPAAGLVYCWWLWLDSRGEVLDASPRWRVEGQALAQLLDINFIGNASVPLYRRSCVVELGGYDEHLHAQGCGGCEDWDLSLKVAGRYDVTYVPAVLVGYRRHVDSMSTRCETMWRSWKAVASAAAARHPSVAPAVLARSRAQFALHLAGVSYWAGRRADAVQWVRRAASPGVVVPVLPYLVRLLGRGAGRASQPRPFDQLADSDLAGRAPLIPYDRICARRWRAGGWFESAAVQAAAVVMATIAIGAAHWTNDGLWFQGDAPRHAVNGLFFWDLLTSQPVNPLDYALGYYARYPVIAPVLYPPLFYLLEGLAFALWQPSPHVAKALVLASAAVLGLYAMAWGRRFAAPAGGWAGACVVLLPGVVILANAVMLNVPAAALGLALLYHLQAWIEDGSPGHSMAAAAFGLASLLTYFPAAVVLLGAAVWMLAAGRARSGLRLLLLPAAIALLVALAAWAFLPVQIARHAPSPARWLSAANWTFYADAVVRLAGGPGVLLGLGGIGAGILLRSRAAVALAVPGLTIVSGLVLLPAMSPRYALLVAPLLVLGAFLGLTKTIALLPGRRAALARVVTAVSVIALVAGSAWSATRVRVPRVAGFDAVARYLRMAGPRDTVLYSGYYDGVFGFYMRALDPGLERRIVLSSQLLSRSREDAPFVRVDTPLVSSPQEVVPLLQRGCGCTWVAVEIGPESALATSERHLRRALEGPEFERVRSFPVTAGAIVRVDLYRVRAPVAPVRSIDLTFPSYTSRVFRGVRPIEPADPAAAAPR